MYFKTLMLKLRKVYSGFIYKQDLILCLSR
jgi:hypothetical protein